MRRLQEISTLLNKDYLKYKVFLFDLDHTLFRVNTSFRFGLFLYKQNVLPLSKMIYLLTCYGLHLMGRLSICSLHIKTMKAFFQGKSINELSRLVDSFLDKYFLCLQNEQIINVLQEVQNHGKFIAILSSSPSFLVEAIAKRLRVDHFLATEYLVNSRGVINGLSILVQGDEKAAFVKSLVNSGRYSKQDIIAFSDSIYDLPFLESAGTPVAVSPDRRLYRLSLEKGWQIS